MTAGAEIERALGLLGRLRELLDGIEQAVVAGDGERVLALLPEQEEIQAQLAHMEFPPSAQVPAGLFRDLEQAVQAVQRRSTRNSVLLREQLALIQVTMRAILGDRQAVNRLA